MVKKKTAHHKEHKEEEEETEVSVSFNTNTVLAIVLAVLFVFSAFQTTQLIALDGAVTENSNALSEVLENGTGVATQTTQAASTSTTSSVPQSLQNIPDMVGGC